MRSFFDGRTAAELRLWDALGADLLCPFHYFAIHDGTDLRSITWSRGKYDETQLDDVFTGNDARARIILQAVADKVGTPAGCAPWASASASRTPSTWHDVFNDAGIPARTVTGTTPHDDARSGAARASRRAK